MNRYSVEEVIASGKYGPERHVTAHNTCEAADRVRVNGKLTYWKVVVQHGARTLGFVRTHGNEVVPVTPHEAHGQATIINAGGVPDIVNKSDDDRLRVVRYMGE